MLGWWCILAVNNLHAKKPKQTKMSCSTERKKKQNELNKKQHKILQDVLAGILLRGGFWSPTIIF